jgi:hypothetical protein
MTYDQWLDSLPFHMTKTDQTGKGAVVDIVICVYPDGFTSLAYRLPGSTVKTEQLLGNEAEGMKALAAIWQRAKKFATEHGPEAIA